MSKVPDFSFEQELWRAGMSLVAGADEVGRGCLAGPVVAGCVIFSSNNDKKLFSLPTDIQINDSKKLKARQREISTLWIKKEAIAWGIGVSSVSEINKLGIVKATHKAYRMAIREAQEKIKIEFLLLDAFYVPFVRGLSQVKQKPIIKGDCKSFSIAAASIIAKVYRDNLMRNLSKNSNYRAYLWGKNKGYGTKEHTNAIKRYGLTNLHRKGFVANYI